MSALGAAAIAGAASLIGSGLSAYGAGKANQKSVDLTREMRRSDIEMWHKQNEYNSPVMQMQRLKEAGLNPNLIYGGGATHTAQQPPSAKVPEVQNELASLSQFSLVPTLSMYQDMKVKNATIDNIQKQTEYTDQRIINETIKAVGETIKNDKDSFSLSQTKRLAESQFQAALLSLESKKADIANKSYHLKMMQEQQPWKVAQMKSDVDMKQLDIKLKNLQYQLDKELKPYGVSGNDNFILRKIAPLLSIPKENSERKKFWNNYFNK